MKSYLKNIISFEALVPFGIVLTVVLIVLSLLSSKTPSYKKQKKQFYLYLAINIAIMALYTAIIYNLKQSNLIFRYAFLMVFSLILGSLHVYFIRLFFKKFESDHRFKEILFALITGLAITLPIVLITAYYNNLHYLGYHFLVILAFILPSCIFTLFNYATEIPVKLYSKWYYPLGKKYDSPEHHELKNMIVVNFMFYKSVEENHITSFKAKAPKDMNFGRLFFFFINDYNHKKTTTKIELTENSGDPYGWYFYNKPKWYGASKHINSDLTIEQNNLKDGDTIICQRI